MPDIAAFLRAKHPSLLSGFADDPSEPALGRTIGFLTFAAERLRNMPDAEHGVIVADILDYARERLQASYYPPGDCRSAFGVVDCLQGEVVSLEEAGELRACLKIGLGLDSRLAANMIHTSDVDTQAARPNGQDRPEDQALPI